MTDIMQELAEKPELLRRVLETAVDAAWGFIDSGSLNKLEGDIEWMDLGHDFDSRAQDVDLLIDLGLLGVHPAHSTWVREIATL